LAVCAVKNACAETRRAETAVLASREDRFDLSDRAQENQDAGVAAEKTPARRLNPAAERALAEAAARRAEKRPSLPREIGGRDGPEPTRYGDWENRGLASDF